MLEIKCPFSREITGIPKKEYWIQCQMQLEVCQLNVCDFLEVKFKEYESEDSFMEDGTFERTANGEYKGVLMQYYDAGVSYRYAPFQCTRADYEEWKAENITDAWVATIFWKMEDVSCVHIHRSPKWFESVLPQLTHMHAEIRKISDS
jgi:hypothetical protein